MGALEAYIHARSPFHQLNPRVKLLCCLGFLVAVATLRSPGALGFALLCLLIWYRSAGLPIAVVLSRCLWALPFGGALAIVLPWVKPGAPIFQLQVGFLTLAPSYAGAKQALVLGLRLWTALLTVNLLLSTTPMRDLLRALEVLKVPVVFIRLIEFTIRYISVTVEEAHRMQLAVKSRAFKARNLVHPHTISTLAHLIGAMLLRSMDRGERIYLAMLARCYTAEKVRPASDLRLKVQDFGLGLLILCSALLLVLVDRGFVGA